MNIGVGLTGGVTERSDEDKSVVLEGEGQGADGASFELLFRQHYPRLVQTLCFTTLDREAAADAAQEAFLQLHLQWERVSHYDNVLGFVYRTGLNRSRDYRRRSLRSLRFRQAETRIASAAPREAEEVTWEPDRGLMDALKGLPDRQRQAAALHYVAGLSEKETAEAMGLSEGTVKSHLFRAREALRKKLEV
jgi:RNA polymerase sigma factor (sigma-70 family)